MKNIAYTLIAAPKQLKWTPYYPQTISEAQQIG
jgi:hypothetical protein